MTSQGNEFRAGEGREPRPEDGGRPTASTLARTTRAMVTCRLPGDLADALRNTSRLTGVSQTDLVASGLRLLLEKPEVLELVEAAKRADLVRTRQRRKESAT